MYCFVNSKTGKFVGLDNSSGYPYETENMLSIHVWLSKKEAMAYKAMFPGYDWKLKKLIGLQLEDVEN